MRNSSTKTRVGRSRTRRGTAYLLVLAGSLIVLTVGMSTLAASRAQRATLAQGDQALQAQLFAPSATHLGLATMNKQIGTWAALGSGLTTENTNTLGNAQLRWRVRETSGVVPTTLNRSLVMQTAATLGPAGAYEQVDLRVRRTPYDALGAAVATQSTASIATSSYLTPIGGPLFSGVSTTVNTGGYIYGDSTSLLFLGSGMTTGVQTTALSILAFPPSTVDDDYYGWATALGTSSTLDRVVIGPNVNPYGSPDPDGLYRMSLSGATTIRRSRILGTLVVKTNGNTLTINDNVRIEPYRGDFPALIVDGNVDFAFNDTGTTLSEATESTNFNPAGVPYQGVTDTDKSDSYPSEIVGLVHITGTLTVSGEPVIRGILLVNGAISVTSNDSLVVYRDAKLYSDPPIGYGTPNRVETKPGTWKRIAAW